MPVLLSPLIDVPSGELAAAVRDITFREDRQRVRTGNQPNAMAGIRNLVTGAFRRAGLPGLRDAA